MENVNPILERVGAGARASWTNGEPQQPKPAKRIPPNVKKLILELGLRFRPQGGENQEEYAAAVTLLAQDVSDVPEYLLDRAVGTWVRTKKWLPRASELIELAQEDLNARTAGSDAGLRQLEAHCERLNASGVFSSDPWVVLGTAPNRRVGRKSEEKSFAKQAA